MPWSRNDPDPLEARRRQLAEQERLLSEQRRRLMEQLYPSGEIPRAEAKPPEPPVWRMEEEGPHPRAAESIPARKRNLARQRRRDMMLFFVFIGLLLVVLVIMLVVYAHSTAPADGT